MPAERTDLRQLFQEVQKDVYDQSRARFVEIDIVEHFWKDINDICGHLGIEQNHFISECMNYICSHDLELRVVGISTAYYVVACAKSYSNMDNEEKANIARTIRAIECFMGGLFTDDEIQTMENRLEFPLNIGSISVKNLVERGLIPKDILQDEDYDDLKRLADIKEEVSTLRANNELSKQN